MADDLEIVVLSNVAELEECSREPIHTPGAIQPHGALLAVRNDFTIVQASESTQELAHIAAASLLGQPLRRVFDPASCVRLERAIGSSSLQAMGPIFVRLAGVPFEALLHCASGLVLIELEPPTQHEDSVGTIKEALDRMQRVRTLAELFAVVAREVKVLTGFDRVMLYRFHPDEHGEVVAEAREPCLEPYLGLHYPASDVPNQARALFLKNTIRVIHDVKAKPSRLVPENNPLTGLPLDLGGAWLRGVSPVHIEYLTNMGVRATMSISLVCRGRLYGLVACHHYTPFSLIGSLRDACEEFGHVISFQIELLEQYEAAEHKLRASSTVSRFITETSQNERPEQELIGQASALLTLMDAQGLAIVDDERVATAGQTPSAEDIRKIVTWLGGQMPGPIFHTDALVEHLPWTKGLASVASGLLATSFSRGLALWFRPEVERTVSWGGNPNKAVEFNPSTRRLGPRTSFDVWRQTVRGRSKPWQPWEIEAAQDVRSAVVEIIVRRSGELTRLNAELAAAVRARDDFLSMASHELRTPIATLKLTLHGLVRSAERSEGSLPVTLVLPRLEVALRQVDRTAALLDQLLEISRLNAGKPTASLAEVDLGEIVRRVSSYCEVQAEDARVQLDVRAEQGIVCRWDESRLEQVVTNLVTNAIKYGAGKPVEITLSRVPGGAELVVQDHGIGIPPEAQERIFERFERAVPSSHYAGFGLGLWIVRQFVEQMGGTIRVESIEGEGATFFVRWPLEAAPGSPDEAEAPRGRG